MTSSPDNPSRGNRRTEGASEHRILARHSLTSAINSSLVALTVASHSHFSTWAKPLSRYTEALVRLCGSTQALESRFMLQMHEY